MSLHKTAASTSLIGIVATIRMFVAPEPWDIAAVVVACVSGGLLLTVYAAASVTRDSRIHDSAFSDSGIRGCEDSRIRGFVIHD